MKCSKCGKQQNPYWIWEVGGPPLCDDCSWNFAYVSTAKQTPITWKFIEPVLIEADPLKEALEKANER